MFRVKLFCLSGASFRLIRIRIPPARSKALYGDSAGTDFSESVENGDFAADRRVISRTCFPLTSARLRARPRRCSRLSPPCGETAAAEFQAFHNARTPWEVRRRRQPPRCPANLAVFLESWNQCSSDTTFERYVAMKTRRWIPLDQSSFEGLTVPPYMQRK